MCTETEPEIVVGDIGYTGSHGSELSIIMRRIHMNSLNA
jgi:hypothetical protein